VAKNLVIVESPAKAKTINKYLGQEFVVKASMGHVRDLPKAKLGVDVEHDFEPQYVIPTDKRKTVEKLKELASKASEVILATDPDRDLAACLPPIAAPDALFDIAPKAAAALGLAAAVKVAVGGGDNMMAAIGTGCVTEGRLAMSLGTSGTLFAYSGSPMIDPDGAWAAFCSSTGGWLPLICTMNCTVATERVASAFGFSTRDGDAHLHARERFADGAELRLLVAVHADHGGGDGFGSGRRGDQLAYRCGCALRGELHARGGQPDRDLELDPEL